MAAARRVVVKVGSSSLTTAAGRHRPAARRRPRRRPGRGSPCAAPRWSWSPRGAIAAGLAPLGLRSVRAACRPAGRGVGRAGAAGGPLHGGARAVRPRRRAGAADRRRRDAARALPQRLPDLRQAARPRRRCRSSTRTTRSPPRRSASATTTGWPRWWPTWSTPTCWSCSRTWTRCTTGTPSKPGTPRSPTCGPSRTWRSPSAAPAGRGRHRRHGDQGRGGPDRDRFRDPGGADRGAARRAALAGDEIGTLFHPTGCAPRPGCSGSPTPPTPGVAAAGRRGGARRRRAPRLAAAGRHHRRRRPFVAGDPWTWSTRTRRRGGPRAGELRRGRAARAAGPLDPRARAALGAAYEREVVHRDDLVLL